MRFAWLLGSCAWLGCTTHVSTSDYGIAAGFAAAAGALQVAELAHNGRSAGSCGPKTCSGCCDAADRCVEGTAEEACGQGGSTCRNCVVNGHQACGDGLCLPGTTASASPVSSTWPPARGSASLTQTSTPSCGQIVVFCFAGTYSICETDPSGCERCSCTPDRRADGTIAP
ncbi:MAG: hypothetical protein M3O46_03695 [Myxococcota bacterium]|nr:hypothetical protein [Myxococcota bacterium]